MAALVLGGASVKAQNLSYGVKAGIQQNNFLTMTKDGDKDRSVVAGIGFHAGAFADYALSKQFSVQPQLLFNSKSVATSKSEKVKVYAIDLPVNFLYKHEGFFAGIGPNFSYGLSAKYSGGNTIDWYEKQDGEGGEKVSYLKRFELGANLVMGYQFSSGVILSTNYMHGLSNISDYGSDHTRTNTRYIGISVGYAFGNRAAK